jgi:D-amino-acid dehydrogenase
MSTTGPRAVVVGAGVIGAGCAYYLCRAGWAVTVVDQGGFGQGCSHANCGFVCPSHVLPLAAPGAIGSAVKALLRPGGPLSIKLRFDPALWAWLYRFARRCNHHDMLEAGRGIQALLNSSRRLYEELLREEPMECEWEARGMLFVHQTRPAMEHYADTDKLMSDTFHVPARRIDGDTLTELEPALLPGLAGGWLYETDAHLRPDRLMASWKRVLEARGVQVREQCGVRALAGEHGRARAVVMSQGELPADAVVVATGALTPLLRSHLGCRIPIQPGKGYSITMGRPARCPLRPMIFEEHRVAVTPMRSAYRLGSTMEFAGYDTSLNRRRLDLLREGAKPYLHEPLGQPVEEEWYGWRPMTPDGLPIIDRSPAWSNVWIAAGHNMLGLSMAPATGKLVAEMLGSGPKHVDPAPYRLGRFGSASV